MPPPSGGTSWKAQVGLAVIWTPIFTKYTPCPFWWFFFRKVTETYEFRNDTCFLSVMLWNLTDYVIIPFLPSRTLRNITDYALTLPFNSRHVTKLHELCYNAFLLASGMSRNFTNCLTMGVKYLEVVKWGSHPNNGWSPDEIRVWQLPLFTCLLLEIKGK